MLSLENPSLFSCHARSAPPSGGGALLARQSVDRHNTLNFATQNEASPFGNPREEFLSSRLVAPISPQWRNPNLIPIGSGFGFLIYMLRILPFNLAGIAVGDQTVFYEAEGYTSSRDEATYPSNHLLFLATYCKIHFHHQGLEGLVTKWSSYGETFRIL